METTGITRFIEKRGALLVGALVLAVFAVGVVYSCGLGDRLRYSDEKEYLRLAENIAYRQVFSLDSTEPTAARPPGYPAMLASLLSLGLDVVHLRILNFVALALSMLLLHRLLRRFSPAAGLLGPVLVLCYPVLFYTAGTLFPQTIASVALLLAVTLEFSDTQSTILNKALIGLCLGVLVLVAPALLIVPVFHFFWIARDRGKKWLAAAAAMLVGVLIVACPWVARNYLVMDRFVFVSTNSGLMLLLGNSENTGPNDGPTSDVARYTEAAKAMDLDSVEADRYFAREAVKHVVSHPVHSAGLYVLKFLNYFNYRNNLRTTAESDGARELIMLVSYGFLLAVALLRLAACRSLPLSRLEMFCLLLYVCNGAFSAIFFTRIRYRLPFDLLLIVVCALALANAGRIFNALRPRSRERASA